MTRSHFYEKLVFNGGNLCIVEIIRYFGAEYKEQKNT